MGRLFSLNKPDCGLKRLWGVMGFGCPHRQDFFAVAMKHTSENRDGCTVDPCSENRKFGGGFRGVGGGGGGGCVGGGSLGVFDPLRSHRGPERHKNYGEALIIRFFFLLQDKKHLAPPSSYSTQTHHKTESGTESFSSLGSTTFQLGVFKGC